MIDFTQAVYDKLAGDPDLTALIATYSGNVDGVSEPAIFTDEEVPENASLPYIWSYGNPTDVPDDDKTDRGRRVTRDILCYADRGEASLLEAISTRVRELFTREQFMIPGAECIVTEAFGPVPAPTGHEDMIGLAVTIRVRYVEEGGSAG